MNPIVDSISAATPASFIDLAALLYMFFLWACYALYAKRRARQDRLSSLSHSMRILRERWVRQMLRREVRVTDASLLASQERVVGFFASATMIILAAVFTALSASSQIADIANHLPLAQQQTASQVQLKLLVIALVLVYAFFMITWSLRQYGFAAVMMGSAPTPDETIDDTDKERFIAAMARLMDTAGHDNNKGLRAYYFCLAMVFWFIHPYIYMLISSVTVLVLAQREFNSKAVNSLESAI
jgi:uncharacterized membrane protein